MAITYLQHANDMRVQYEKEKEKLSSELLKHLRFYYTLILLDAYAYNPDDFQTIIDKKIWEHYNFKSGLEHPYFMWQAIENMLDDLVFGRKYFKLVPTGGLITILCFSSKKASASLQEIDEFMIFPKGWGI